MTRQLDIIQPKNSKRKIEVNVKIKKKRNKYSEKTLKDENEGSRERHEIYENQQKTRMKDENTKQNTSNSIKSLEENLKPKKIRCRQNVNRSNFRIDITSLTSSRK